MTDDQIGEKIRQVVEGHGRTTLYSDDAWDRIVQGIEGHASRSGVVEPDGRADVLWPDGDRPPGSHAADFGPVPVELTRASGRRSSWNRVLSVAAVVVVCLLVVAVPIGLGLSNRRKDDRITPETTAKAQVVAALNATTASGSYHITSRLWETPPPSTAVAEWCSAQPPTIIPCPARLTPASGSGTINLRPFAILTLSDVSNFGQVMVWTDGTYVWQQGGPNSGLERAAPTGLDTPLSQFAGLVERTLDRRLGGVSILNLASPTGHLTLPQEAITDASKIGAASVDGVAVTNYEVILDRSKSLALPDMTAEQMITARAAFEGLQQEGYQDTKLRLAIDEKGFIRQSNATDRFADGGTVSGETRFSDFGCAGTVVISRQTGLTIEPGSCATPSTVPPLTTDPPSTTTPATTTPRSTTPPPTTGPVTARAYNFTAHMPDQWKINPPSGPRTSILAYDPGPGCGGKACFPHDFVAEVLFGYTLGIDDLAPTNCFRNSKPPDSAATLVDSGFRPIGDRTAEWRQWSIACQGLTEIHDAWLLPVSHIAIYENCHGKRLQDVIATAEVSDGTPSNLSSGRKEVDQIHRQGGECPST